MNMLHKYVNSFTFLCGLNKNKEEKPEISSCKMN